MSARRAVLAAAVVLLAALAEEAAAVPAFARRYGVSCRECHERGFPKLNLDGRRFKERGFRGPGDDTFDFAAWARSLPVSARVQLEAGFGGGEDDVQSAGVKGIAAGSLGDRLSFWVDTGVRLRSGSGDTFAHTRPDNAWARLEVVRGGRLYVKGGRFELDLPFTQARSPQPLPYEIYAASTGRETDELGLFHDGVEVGGALPRDVRWSMAVVSGRDAPGAADDDTEAGGLDGNLFLRLAKSAGEHRFGAFFYVGRNLLAPAPGLRAEDHLLRLGLDADLRLRRVDLHGLLVYGRNDNSVVDVEAPLGTGEALSFGGGFLQAHVPVGSTLVLMLRGDLVSRPPGTAAATRQSYVTVAPGLQFFVRERVRLAFEYGFRNAGRGGRGAVQVDLAF